MIVNLLTEHNLEFLSSKGGCRGSPESTLVKMSNCWISHAAAHCMLYPLTDIARSCRLELLQLRRDDACKSII